MQQNNDLGYLINHLSNVLARHSNEILLERLGFGMTQYKILTALLATNGKLQKKIAEELGLTQAGISRQIKIMSEMRLIHVTINPANKREHIIRLTTQGEQKTNQAISILKNVHNPLFNILQPHQYTALIDGLNKLHNYTCNTNVPGSCSSS